MSEHKQKKKAERAERNRLKKSKVIESKKLRIDELKKLQKMLAEVKAKRAEREAAGEVFENDVMTDLVKEAFGEGK